MTERQVRVRLYALRHGEPASRTVFYGHDDIALSDRGMAQAQAQADVLSDTRLAAVWSSDLQRAHLGASEVASRHGLSVQIDPDLREMHLGPLEGVAHADARARFPELARRRYEDMLDVRFQPMGESVRDVAQRLDPCVDAAILEAAAGSNGRSVGIVVYAHNTVTRLLLARAAGLGPEGFVRFAQGYGAMNRIDLVVGAGQVRWDVATVVHANRDPLVEIATK